MQQPSLVLPAATFQLPQAPDCTSPTRIAGSLKMDMARRRQVMVQGRLVGLDVLRGITGALMLFCVSGGGGYWWLQDSQWDGAHTEARKWCLRAAVSGFCRCLHTLSSMWPLSQPSSHNTSDRTVCLKVPELQGHGNRQAEHMAHSTAKYSSSKQPGPLAAKAG